MDGQSARGVHVLIVDFDFNDFARGSIETRNAVTVVAAGTHRHFFDDSGFAVRNFSAIHRIRGGVFI